MKKRCLLFLGALLVFCMLAGCECKHEWAEATCTEPKTCTKCGETEGEALGHTWIDATCTEPKTCSVCGATEGDPAGHDWADATCTEPKTCTVCGETEGKALGHDWVPADCTNPKTCSRCKETEGQALGHKWDPATCTEPKTCSVCGATEGDPLGHTVDEWETTVEATCLNEGEQTGVCTVCGQTVTETLPITDHTPGEWVVTKEPTEDEPGEWTQYCAVCGEVVATEPYELSAEEIAQRFKDNCTSYSYDTIARDPGSYEGTYAKYTGKVIQVMESNFWGSTIYTLRVNVTKTKYSYEDTIYVTYTQSEDSPRILEDDIITIWGTNEGTKTYETIFGASITIPQVDAKYVEIQ